MADEKLLGRFEMLWDCPFCDTKRLLGVTHAHCPNCGAVQDQTKRYFPSDAEKVAVRDDYEGVDKKCGSCDAPNGAKTKFCVKCGAPLDDAAAVKVRSDQVVAQGAQFVADDVKKAEAELGSKAKPQPVAVKKKSYWWVWLILGVLAFCTLIWFLCIRKRTADFVVEEHRWKKTIAVEEWKRMPHEDWQDKLPSNALDVNNCHDKQFDTKKVPDGQDCQMRRKDKGDGTFTEVQECTPKYRNEPIEKTWCSYQLLEWAVVDHKEASTLDGSEPTWPVTGIKAPTAVLGNIPEHTQREGERKELFEVDVFDAKNKERATCAVNKDLWLKLPKGGSAKGEERAQSGDIVCDSLRAK
jgi:hypothetical protein